MSTTATVKARIFVLIPSALLLLLFLAHQSFGIARGNSRRLSLRYEHCTYDDSVPCSSNNTIAQPGDNEDTTDAPNVHSALRSMPRTVHNLSSPALNSSYSNGTDLNKRALQSHINVEALKNSSAHGETHLEPRAPANWNAAVRKGREAFLTMLDPRRTKQSAWLDPKELANWGWNEASALQAMTAETNLRVRIAGLQDAFREEEITMNTQNSRIMEKHHNAQTEHNGKVYPATGAEYNSVYSPSQGTIVVNDRYSPSWKISVTPSLRGASPPSLQHWSDVAYLSWASVASSSNLRNLRQIFFRHITNRATHALIEHAIGYRPIPPPWGARWIFKCPQTLKISSSDDKYFALLGSENVLGVAWLLAQHRLQLGARIVISITVWWDGTGGQSNPVYNILVEIGGSGE